MKKQNVKSLKLNKSLVSNLKKNSLKGGLNWTYETPSHSCFDCAPTGQTGSWCLTGNRTNCQ